MKSDNNKNPFAFKPYEERMRKDKAVNYIPPSKRKIMKDYLSNTSFKITDQSQGLEPRVSHYQRDISNSKAVKESRLTNIDVKEMGTANLLK